MKFSTSTGLRIIQIVNSIIILVAIVSVGIAYLIPFGLAIFLSSDALKALVEADATIIGLFGAISVYFLTSIDQKIDKIDERLANQTSNWVKLESRKHKIMNYKRKAVWAIFSSLVCLVFSFFFSMMALGIATIDNATQTVPSLKLTFLLTVSSSVLLFIGILGILYIVLKMGIEPENM